MAFLGENMKEKIKFCSNFYTAFKKEQITRLIY